MENLSQMPSNGQPDPQEVEKQRAQEEQLRRDMMATVLEPAARERCL
jgi:DNA-binding TFAR19-related protein (PDSD5 family)